MENKSHALLAGLFTIALLVAAVLVAMWFQRDRSDTVPYQIATKLSVPGLNPQAAVRYRGLDVGKVDDIAFDPQVPGQILIRLSVKPDTPVTKSTFAMLGYQGVTGIAYVQLDDDGSSPVVVHSSEHDLARIELRPSLFDTLQNKGLAILNQTEELSRRLNNMLNPANEKMVISAFDNVGRAAVQIETVTRQLQPTLAKLPAVTDQANKTLASIGALSNNVSMLTTTLQAPNGAVDKLVTTIDQLGTIANKIELQALPLSNDARYTMRTLNRTLDAIREQPQSLLFGPQTAAPGPGEPGFAPPSP